MSNLRRAIAMATLGTSAPALAQPMPTLVSVESYRSGTNDSKAIGSTLGVVVEAEGFVLTTYRALVDPDTGRLLPRLSATVAGPDGPQRLDARVVGVEPTLDFAVLKLNAEEAFVPSNIRRDRGLETGQTVFAATGVPGAAGDEPSLAAGTLVSLNSIECYQESLTQTMYQAEMIIPDGGLGSPVFDKNGSVIAMYTGYEPPHTPGDSDVDDPSETHLLPIFLAFNIYDSIKSRQSLESPWTGFSVRSLTEEEAQRIPEIDSRFKSGIALDFIWPDSPAEKLGLREGDVLLYFAHHEITAPADFQKWLYMYGVGRDVKLVLLRDDKPFVLKYTIEKRPEWAVPK